VLLSFPSPAPSSTQRPRCADQAGLRSFGSTGKEHPKLIYNCTAYFLSLALADNALFGIQSLEDLQKLEIPAGEEELGLSFKESALDRPILRKCTKEKGTLEEMMPKSAFLRIFQAMMKKAGYFCGTSIHAVRRYLGKKVDGKSHSPDYILSSAAGFPRPGGIYACQLADPRVQRDIGRSSALST
jgi:hypothetical protein